MPYIRCKLNKIGTYRHYRYTWTVWNEKYSLHGVKKEAKWGQNANYRQFHYGDVIYSLQVEQKSLHIVITDIPGQCEMKNIRYWGNQALPGR